MLPKNTIASVSRTDIQRKVEPWDFLPHLGRDSGVASKRVFFPNMAFSGQHPKKNTKSRLKCTEAQLKWLGMEGSNLRFLIQSQASYHWTNPQRCYSCGAAATGRPRILWY